MEKNLPKKLNVSLEPRMIGTLTENVVWRDSRSKTISGTIRTHLLKLSPLPGFDSQDTALLVYEAQIGKQKKFVTAFPVAQSFADTLIQSKPARGSSFKPRFNLYVDPRWSVVSYEGLTFQKSGS